MSNKKDEVLCFFCNKKIKDGIMCDNCEDELIDYMSEHKETDYLNNWFIYYKHLISAYFF